jgi:glucan phosphorylase
MFPEYAISSVTNGVHSVTWTSEPFRSLFDRYVPGWREDPALLRQAMRIPADDLRRAHLDAKRALLDEVRRLTGRALALDALTIGFARRATAYKRADLIFSDLSRLRALRRMGPLQLLFLDGWWIEGHIEGVTGWSIGRSDAEPGSGADDAADLYAKLPVVLEVFQNDPERWAAIMRSAIALNASFFNTQRMVLEYATNAYLL